MAVFLYVVYIFLLSSLSCNAQLPQCGEEGVVSVCSSCQSQQLCVTNTTAACGDGLICKPGTETAICSAPSEATDCKCKVTSGISYQCDFYNKKTITTLCYDGEVLSSVACPEGTECVEGSKECAETTTGPPTVEATTAVPTTCDKADLTPSKENCTSFQLCTTEGSPPKIILCKPGEIYSELLGDCTLYSSNSTFICTPGKSGLFANPFDCKTFFLCGSDGKQGDKLSCSSNQEFSNTEQKCIPAPSDTPCVDDVCTPCTSNLDSFPNPVGSTACTSEYLQCANDTNMKADYLKLVIKKCPPDFFYDTENQYCSPICNAGF